MKREIIFSMESPFRDTFRIHGFRFGSGEKSLAIVGAMRGDEIHQQYVCSQVVRRLAALEAKGLLTADHEILVIPSANPFSMNIGKRFWAMDNTDINRMFPGYDLGETTQRIAAALFNALQGYKYGVQLASRYIPGDYVPHVRIIETGYEDTASASLFGLPYVCLRKPLPFDTTLLNYNWQIWETKAFSIYGGLNDRAEDDTAKNLVNTLFHFMRSVGITARSASTHPGYDSLVFNETELTSVRTPVAGIMRRMKKAADEVRKGELMALITDPYDGETLAEITAPSDGVVFFANNKPLALQNALLFKII